MAQHDYVIANQSGSAFRADLNNALAASVSINSGSSAPSTTYAYMLWADTTNNVIKLRNSANNSWITLFTTTGGLSISSASTFNEDVTFDGATAGRDMVWDRSDNALEFGSYAQIKLADQASIRCGTDDDLQIYHNGTDSWLYNSTGELNIRQSAGGDINLQPYGGEDGVVVKPNAQVELYYDNVKKFSTTSEGALIHGRGQIGGNDGGTFIADIQNDGNDANRYGLQLRCGADDGSGTNYAVAILTGNGTTQGYITFSGGTVTYGTFTAYHPCIVPDSENPSDNSNAYPYGTLLETISIEYTQKNGSDTERGIRYKVQKTQSANSRKVLGAYGSSMNGGPDNQTNEHQALVLGDGHILVNNAGGNIEVGDGICSSATAGIGQKATANPSMIIGIAQEAITFTGSETKLVAVQYGLQQFIPWS